MRIVRSNLLVLGCVHALVACGAAPDDEPLATATSALAPPGFLDVTTVGAIGNGVTDNTGVLASATAALNTLCPNQGICGLFFPAGTYLSDTLTLPPNRQITAAGGAVLRGKPGGTGPVLVLSAGDAISILGIDGNRSGRPSGGDCVFGNFASGVSLNNVSVFNCMTNGVELASTTGYTISSSSISSCNQDGRSAGINLGFSSGGQVLNNSVSSCPHGILWWGGDSATTLSTGISNVTISNNTVSNIARGCIWGSAGQGITVSGNTVAGCGDVGIDLEGTSNSSVTSNFVTSANNGGITTFFGSSSDMIIGNTVNQTANPGPGIHFYGTRISSALTVSGNIIHTSTNWGISMESNVIGGLTISNNTITVDGSIGDIQVIGAPGPITINSNTLMVAGPFAISVQSSNNVFATNNMIHSQTGS
ncbi:MAG TPA: right-handed parallel beta-helix repeat-containing protein [Kofleriaceae bacterium]|jgi:parallel beta-helix repeat protein|nr:right-handed parallel beta-helix repeat-containing protein [Kofleriaceae bacterium]